MQAGEDGKEAVQRTPRRVARVDGRNAADAARSARHSLDAGAEGLALVFDGAPNAFGRGLPPGPRTLAAVLDDVPLDRCHLRIDVHPASRATAEQLFAYLGARRIPPDRLDLSLGIDPAAIFAGTGRLRMGIEALEASMPQSLSHFFALNMPGVLLEADGRVFHNAGATPAQEVGATLASAASFLRMFELARQPLQYAAPHIGFALAVDHGPEAAVKLHALRLAWGRLLGASGIEAAPLHLHVETSWRMLRGDRSTDAARIAQALAAAEAGGADTISVATLDGAEPARDAGVPSHAIPETGAEASRLVDDAWSEFERIHAEGGILRSLQAGHLQSRVRGWREAAPRPDPSEGAAVCEPLPPARG